MAKRSESHDTLAELQSRADRLALWLRENPTPFLAVLGVVLLVAAAVGGWQSWQYAQRDEASSALAEARRDYRQAMGAQATDLEIPEPANPETGRRVRGEYVERFLQVAEAHEGSGAASIARLEAGQLQLELGREEEALASWQTALAEVPEASPLAGLLHERVALAHERSDRWLEAARAHEAAASVTSFPPRYLSMADAARCYARAGETATALSLYQRLQAEAPDVELPAHVRARLQELAYAGSASS